MSDRRTPFLVAGERETLLAFLEYLREAVLIKASGIDDDALRRSLVPSGTSLLGLVKHLTMVEVAWFQWSFAGLDVPVPNQGLEPGDTTESVIAGYRAAIGQNNALLADRHDLDELCARKATAPAEPMSLRWVLVHMVEETGRHAGHADILREQLDGRTGR
jgi:uncharacterized damage-inducible protein DinB